MHARRPCVCQGIRQHHQQPALETCEVKDFELTDPYALSHRAQTACGRPAAPRAEKRTEDAADKILGEVDDEKVKHTRMRRICNNYARGTRGIYIATENVVGMFHV